jgi:hypothetical protein
MIRIAIAVYMVGLLILYTWGQINTGWHDVYYLWDKGKDLVLFLGVYHILPLPNKKFIVPVLWFSLIRFVWQIISTLTGLNINNTEVVGWLFIIAAGTCSYLMLKGFKEWHTRK